MDKKTKTLIIVVSIIGVLLIALMIGLFTLIGKTKTPITAENFKSAMEEKGYVVGDVISQYEEYGYFKEAYIAASKDYSYQIEFYVLMDDEYGRLFYENNKAIFENLKNNASMTAETNVNLKNSSKYTLTIDGYYRAISRIDNTVIYVNVSNDYKETVKDILKEFGY